MNRIEGASSESPGGRGDDTNTLSREFILSLDSTARVFMVSWNTSARLRESTGPLGTNLTADFWMAKSQSFGPEDGWFACNLDDQPFYGSSH